MKLETNYGKRTGKDKTKIFRDTTVWNVFRKRLKKKLKIHVKQQNFLPKVKFETQRKKGRKVKQKQVKKDNDTERFITHVPKVQQ